MFKISVIVPVYKKQEQLPDALKSLAAQTVFEDIQLILVDDGSPDACGKICDEFARKNSNTVVIHKENGGVSSARNAGLDAATGEYIGFVDADDTVSPDYFENLLKAVQKGNCDMAFGTMTLIWSGEHRRGRIWYGDGTVLDKNEIINGFARRMLTDGSQNSACTKLIKRSTIKENNIRFPVGIKIGEDKQFVLGVLKHCSSAVCAGVYGYFYLDVASSAMHSDKKMLELLDSYEYEVELFCDIGLNEKTVREEKSVYLFHELADFLQRNLSCSRAQAKEAVKQSFENEILMEKIDESLKLVKQNSGRIYNMLADAFSVRSVRRTLFVLGLQRAINERGGRK